MLCLQLDFSFSGHEHILLPFSEGPFSCFMALTGSIKRNSILIASLLHACLHVYGLGKPFNMGCGKMISLSISWSIVLDWHKGLSAGNAGRCKKPEEVQHASLANPVLIWCCYFVIKIQYGNLEKNEEGGEGSSALSSQYVRYKAWYEQP